VETIGGISLFSENSYCDDMFEKYLDPTYFEVVCSLPKFPRYTNKRVVDPQLKMFVDETKITVPCDWQLPIPNMEAAYKSLSKYAKNIPLTDEQTVMDMNRAWSYTARHFSPYMGESRVVGLEEAIERMDMSTSTGIPFNRVYPTKRELFEKDLSIREWLEADWDLLAADPDWTCIANNSLKEELRTAVKISENSIRTFTAMGLDATCHGTRLFVDQNEKLTKAHLQCASCVGMSPYKGNWNQLYLKLDTFKNGYALDESQYDSSLRSYMMWGCARLRWSLLREEDRTINNLARVKTYYRNLVNTIIMTPKGVLIMKKGGNPSGSVNTISDNTLILYTLMAFAWIRTARSAGMESYEDFETLTSKALVGYDNTWTVSDEAHVFYNGRSVIEQWKVIGITTTADTLEPRRAKELDFLSSQFLPYKGTMVAVYERSKLMSSLAYAPQKLLDPATSLQRAAGLLAVGWTDLQFRKFCRSFINWLMLKYDKVMAENPRWIAGKSQLQTDPFYEALFTGRNLRSDTLYMQCMETQERLMKPYKNITMSNSQTRRRQRKNNGKKGTQAKARAFIGPMNRPQKKQRRKRTRNNGQNQISRTMRVDNSSQFGGSGVVRNKLFVEKPEPFHGDEPVGLPFLGNNPAGTIYGSIAFNQNVYPINPGLPAMFPRLSRQASLYERYKFTFLEFYYQHDVSQFHPEGTSGLVYLSAKYDAASPPPANTTQIDSSEPKVRCMPSENCILTVNPAQLHPRGEPKFVRPGSLPGGSDIKFYDAGNLFTTTSGQAANTTEIGKLFVRYRGFFYTQVLESTVQTAPLNNQVSLFTTPTLVPNISGGGTTTPFATTVTNGLVIAGNTTGAFVLPVGNYIIDYDMEFNGTTATVATLALQVNGGTVSSSTNAINANNLSLEGSSFYISSNGSDIWTISYSIVGTVAGTYISTVRFVAV